LSIVKGIQRLYLSTSVKPKERCIKTMTTKVNEKQEMQASINYLMFQLRHMRWKYDLMVEEEINIHYQKNKQSFSTYEMSWQRLIKRY